MWLHVRNPTYGEGAYSDASHGHADGYRPQKTGLTEYLASLRRISDGLMSLKKSNLRSGQKAMGQMVSICALAWAMADDGRAVC